ncbi:MAG: Ig-like domain-containing protein, partial [Anaerolineaceae bacterium]|nr:Ig-like domain-containing protein [Anaerolineaceae bacterium]
MSSPISPTSALFIIHHSLFIILAILLTFTACTPSTAAKTTDPTPTSLPSATPTTPPPPKVTYTPVEPGTVSPVIVQRFPRRGEELAADGTIELIFDRAMDQDATADAFTLQTAADQPQEIEGDITWPDERTMQFTPVQPLDQDSSYDVILTQDAVADDSAPLAEPFTFRFSTPGFLEVTQVIPADGTTDVETKATITVMFNRPVVPLTSLAEAEKFPQPLEFEPAIPGRGEWLNTSIYVFTPDGDLPGGMTFTARVKAGLTDVAEKTDLPHDFEWRFTTQPPEVVFTSPNDGQTLVPIENPIQITFSQPVETQSAQDKFELTATGSLFGGSVSGQFEVISETLTFTPTEPLEFDTRYNVTIDAGVTGEAGGSGMVSPYSFGFTTVPLPRIVGTEPADGDNNAWPYTGFTILFNTPINPATVMNHVEMIPPLPVTPTLVYTSYSPWNNSFNFSFGAQPSTAYEVRISPGIEDPYGNQTAENLNVQFRTQPLPPDYQLRMPDFVGTYDAALPAKMVVSYVNVNTLNLRLYKLNKDAVFDPWEWSRDNLPASSNLVREWQEKLEAPTNQQAFQVIDLVDGGGALDPGVYLLDTDSPQFGNDNYYHNHRHVLVVTHINLTLKTGQREAMVWATGLADGEPISGQEIVFYNTSQHHQIETVTTDGDGLARVDLTRNDGGGIVAYIDAEGDNFSAVSENWTRGISPYEFGVDFAQSQPSYNVHIYTDRPIYRPGQTIYFKGIIRREDDVAFSRPDVGQVKITVLDAAYETVLEKEVEVSPAGTFNGSVDLEEGASLGNYTIGARFGANYIEQYVQVAAYRPPEFEVTVEPSEPELLRGEDVEATIHTNYFFGGPLAGADVTWNVLAESYRFDPPQLGAYRFTDADDPYVCFECWWWQSNPFPQPILDGSGASDAAGQLSLTLEGQELDEILETGSQRLTIEASATGPDNQFISGRSSVVIHKGDYYIGLSPQEQVADANEETAIDLIAVDWDAQRLADKMLDVQIVRYEWVNTFIEGAGGGYWKSETQKELVDQFTVTTDAQGEAIARFTPPQGGSYQIIAQDQATLDAASSNNQSPDLQSPNLPVSPIRSSIFVWVAGEDDISWRRENNDRITLISDKASYEPGETAEILIPSPFEGKHYALVTVERGRIIEQEVIEMTSTSQVYQLPIAENYAPNIYVSVVLVQGREGPTTDDAPRLADYKVGILPIDVKLSAQLLNISLTASPEQAEPGSEITYNLEVTDVNNKPVSAEFSLDLVDKAVLSLQPRQPEAIVKAYYDRRALGISTASGLSISGNRLLLELAEDLGLDKDDFAEAAPPAEAPVAEMEAAAPAPQALAGAPAPTNVARAEDMVADEAMGSAAANKAQIPAGVEVREEFSDTAFWEPVIVTDESGQAEVTLTLPDNLTTWVMRGVGVTNETQVGEATTELVATMPLLIRPVAPRFLVVDDKAQLAANITNNTDKAIEAEITLSADGVIIDSATAAVQTVDVPARGETKVTWDVTAEDVTETELVFAAVSTDGEYSDAAKPRLTTGPDGSLLVYRYTAPDIVGTAGQLTE